MKKLLLVGSATMLLLSHSVVAELVTADDIDDMRRINFSFLKKEGNVSGPIQIGAVIGFDVTAETSSGNSSVYTNSDSFNFVGNGSWNPPKTYLALNTSGDELLIKFNFGNVSQVGAFMNYATGGQEDLVITAYDSNMAVLETHNITNLADISTPGGLNEGAFRGIERPQADIAVLGISGYYPAIDHLTFSSFVPAN